MTDYEKEDKEYAAWLEWWDGLSDEDRARERALMDAHVADVEARRARGEVQA